MRQCLHGILIFRHIAWRLLPKVYKEDGVKQVKYKLAALHQKPLYTWILVDLENKPIEVKCMYESLHNCVIKLNLGIISIKLCLGQHKINQLIGSQAIDLFCLRNRGFGGNFNILFYFSLATVVQQNIYVIFYLA